MSLWDLIHLLERSYLEMCRYSLQTKMGKSRQVSSSILHHHEGSVCQFANLQYWSVGWSRKWDLNVMLPQSRRSDARGKLKRLVPKWGTSGAIPSPFNRSWSLNALTRTCSKSHVTTTMPMFPTLQMLAWIMNLWVKQGSLSRLKKIKALFEDDVGVVIVETACTHR